jgi:hypothetical protein
MEVDIKNVIDITEYRISNDEKGAYVEALVKYKKNKFFSNYKEFKIFELECSNHYNNNFYFLRWQFLLI